VIGSNSVKGGKSGATFTEDVLIPKFVEAEKARGVDVSVKFQGDGSDDEVYKQKLSLDLSNKSGADLISIDGIWVGEFARAGYIKPPLTDTVGDAAKVNDWDGWKQIPESVQQLGMFDGKRYGVPGGTDGPGAVLQQEAVRPGRTAGRLAAEVVGRDHHRRAGVEEAA
jgi:multiple sugar transport system substrate-binding protein